MSNNNGTMGDWLTWCFQNILNGNKRFCRKSGEEFDDWSKTKLKNIVKYTKSNHELKDIDVEHTGRFPLFTTGKIYKKVPFYDMEEPYISINMNGAPGKVQLLPACSSVNSTQAYLTLKGDDDYDIGYVFSQLNQIPFQRFIQGTTIKSIKWRDIRNIRLDMPEYDEQRMIGNFLMLNYEYSTYCENELDLMKLFKKGLLQQMFC